MGKRRSLCSRLLIAHALVASGVVAAQESALRPAAPVDAVDSIVAAFRTHDLVALTTHGYEEEGELWRSLLAEPELQRLVDDIVVEFGSARFQGVMDRFTSGDEVPSAQLAQAWQQTTQPHHVSDASMYGDFFRAVRDVNASLPREERLRVVLAEPPIDWSSIDDFDDLLPWLQRRFPHEAEVVEREVLSKGRKALLLAGSGHYLNETPLLNAIDAHGKSLLKVWTAHREDLTLLQPSAGGWPKASFAPLQGTLLGAADIASFYGVSTAPPGPLEEQFDAVLYLGAPADLTEAQLAPELCSDRVYLDMRLPRLRMAADNGAPGWLREFTDYCAEVALR